MQGIIVLICLRTLDGGCRQKLLRKEKTEARASM